MTLPLFFSFLFGTVVGSFLNVVVYRLGTGETMVRGRSRCFSCGKTLHWHELIPIVSFIAQGGRCRGCGSRISWQYPIVEFISGVVFVLIGFKILQNFQFPISNFQAIFNSKFTNFVTVLVAFVYFVTIFSFLLALSVYDYRHKIIPNQLVYPFIALALLFVILEFVFCGLFGNCPPADGLEFGNSAPLGSAISHVVAGVGAFLFFGGLWYFSHGRWMGFGDAKLALGIGFLLGPWLTAVAVLLSFWIGTLIAVPFALFRGGGLKTQVPFGPFLALGAFTSWLWGERLIMWYLGLF